MKALPLLSVGIACALLFAGATVLLLNDRAEASALTRFSSDLELRNFLSSHAPKGGLTNEAIADAAPGAARTYSGTNLQVPGVDEGDIVKTDGQIIFIADGSKVHIISTHPVLANLTDIDLKGPSSSYSYVQGLYVKDGRLVVVYNVFEQHAVSPVPLNDGVAMYYPYDLVQSTYVDVYDLEDPTHPYKVGSAGVTGLPVTTRMIGDTVYIVSMQSVWSGDDVLMPQVSTDGANQSVAATSVNYDPECPEISNFVNLLAYNVMNGEHSVLSALIGPASVTYMSETSLYITMQHWKQKNVMPLGQSPASVTTDIFRIAVDGTSMHLAARGVVEGWPLNQFALDERDGRLRVATTTSWSDPSNNVYVLDLGLNKIGSLEGIAPGERIFSSRYLDDRLYLVTFRQVDPLFIVDLSSDLPQVIGELKVPGASTYLQMVNEGLLGIGFENGSVKVSLYNVTDPANMVEVGTYVVDGYSYSPAQQDHKAVLYDPDHGLLVIPVTVYGGIGEGKENWTYYRPWSAALVMHLDGNGVQLVGQVVHQNSTVERSLYIGDVLYTISDTTVRASSLPGLDPLGQLTFGEGQRYYGWYDAEPMPMLVD